MHVHVQVRLSTAIVYIKFFFYFVTFFASMLEEDLANFEDGVTADMFTKAKDRGTHYQISEHKLYREDECMFPNRYVTRVTHVLST